MSEQIKARRGRCCCERCKYFHGMHLEKYDKVVAHCEAYPDGIPEAVFYAGHRYPKPDDNGLQFTPKTENDLPKYLSNRAENKRYRELKEYYEELDMSDEEWEEKQRKRIEKLPKPAKPKPKPKQEKKVYNSFLEEILDEVQDAIEEARYELELQEFYSIPPKRRRETEPKIW